MGPPNPQGDGGYFSDWLPKSKPPTGTPVEDGFSKCGPLAKQLRQTHRLWQLKKGYFDKKSTLSDDGERVFTVSKTWSPFSGMHFDCDVRDLNSTEKDILDSYKKKIRLRLKTFSSSVFFIII